MLSALHFDINCEALANTVEGYIGANSNLR